MSLISDSEYNRLGSGISDIGSGIGGFYRARGNKIEADNYRQAAKFADLEAKLQNATTTVETAQVQRQAYQGIGRAEAGIAGAGFGEGGSAGDILRSSAQQGALQAAMAQQTGQVAELGFREQERSYNAMAKAADEAAKAQKIGSAISIGTGTLKIASLGAF